MIGRTNAGGGSKPKVITGSFTANSGNVNSFSVSGISFEPKFLIIKNTNSYAASYGSVNLYTAYSFVNNIGVCTPYNGSSYYRSPTDKFTMTASKNGEILVITITPNISDYRDYYFSNYYTDSDGAVHEGTGTYTYYLYG